MRAIPLSAVFVCYLLALQNPAFSQVDFKHDKPEYVVHEGDSVDILWTFSFMSSLDISSIEVTAVDFPLNAQTNKPDEAKSISFVSGEANDEVYKTELSGAPHLPL